MTDLATFSRHDEVAVITIDNPPLNVLGPAVLKRLAGLFQQALDDDGVNGIVLIGAGRAFSAGADIAEFEKILAGDQDSVRQLHHLHRQIEQAPKPVVCAIHGTCLGGGTETAIACHYRVAKQDARIGLPEVKLGLLPGAGGTQRLPRLAGIAQAAEMCATGRMISATEAAEAGIVDRIVEGDLLDGAVKFAKEQVATGQSPRKTRDISERLDETEAVQSALEQLKEQVSQKARGQIAPLKAIEAVEMAATVPFDEALDKEWETFQELLASEQSQGLIHIFFGERNVAKVPGIAKDMPRRTIERAAVIGGGTMGGGITMCYVNAGIPVTLKETGQEQLDRGMESIRKNYQASVKRGRLTEDEVEERMSLITPTLDDEPLREADIIVEAVFENLGLKKRVFSLLDKLAAPHAILASNTSTLDIDAIASATSRPESVIGHHFFSPANVMKLLEIVRGKATSEEVIATSMALAKRLGKVGVLVGNCFGFVGNRMFDPYQREAEFLVEEGAGVEQVDRALYDFGMAMGPLAVSDLAGIDVSWRIRQEHEDHFPPGMRRPLVADQLYEMRRYGQKTEAGWYCYEGRQAIADPDVEELIEQTAQRAGIARRTIDDREIIERTIYALINEGARLLEEGIALRAVDIDVAYVYGYAFPAWRGGPMKFADTVGLETVLERVRHFEQTHGFWWQPAPLLEELATAEKSFAEFDRERVSLG